MGEQPRLEVLDLDVGVPGRLLLRGFCCRVEAGEARVLRGPSGCGKSTLLRTIAALHADPAEHVRSDGRTPSDTGITAWRRRCAYVAQTAPMWPGTVRDNLARPYTYRVAAGAVFDAERASELLDRLGLLDVLDRDANELSGGEKQRVHLVRALQLEPRLVLLDEPVAALDPTSAATVWAALKARLTAGAACLIVTHGESPDWATVTDLGRFRA